MFPFFFALREEEGTAGVQPLVQITPKNKDRADVEPGNHGFPDQGTAGTQWPRPCQKLPATGGKSVCQGSSVNIYPDQARPQRKKLKLFPTHYLKAIALFYEAEDFARPNTVDAYEYAIELYEEALYHFKVSLRAAVNRWMLRYIPWRTGFRFHLIYARTHTCHIKAIVQWEIVSTLSGRKKKSFYGGTGRAAQRNS